MNNRTLIVIRLHQLVQNHVNEIIDYVASEVLPFNKTQQKMYSTKKIHQSLSAHMQTMSDK